MATPPLLAHSVQPYCWWRSPLGQVKPYTALSQHIHPSSKHSLPLPTSSCNPRCSIATLTSEYRHTLGLTYHQTYLQCKFTTYLYIIPPRQSVGRQILGYFQDLVPHSSCSPLLSTHPTNKCTTQTTYLAQ